MCYCTLTSSHIHVKKRNIPLVRENFIRSPQNNENNKSNESIISHLQRQAHFKRNCCSPNADKKYGIISNVLVVSSKLQNWFIPVLKGGDTFLAQLY